jgi:hypothetical protein
LEHFWCTDESQANTDSQDSPWPELEGNHHLPPYSIFCAWPPGLHPNVILSWDSQIKVPRFPKLRLLWLWKPIILCADLRLRWGLKKSYSPHRELFNSMLHATFTQVNQSDFLLLVVESQIGNLTPGPSLGHNLYFKYSN